MNIVGSYGINVILDLNSSSFIWLISIPSISIDPFCNSTILLNARQMVLLPAPDLPTTPIFSPLFTLKLRLFRTVSVSGRYYRETFLNSNTPFSGHLGLSIKTLEFLSCSSSTFSYGTSISFKHRTTLTILPWIIMATFNIDIRFICIVKTEVTNILRMIGSRRSLISTAVMSRMSINR